MEAGSGSLGAASSESAAGWAPGLTGVGVVVRVRLCLGFRFLGPGS